MKKSMSWPFLLTVFVLLFGFHSSEAQEGPIQQKIIDINSQAPDLVTDGSGLKISEFFLEEGDYYLVRGRKVYLRRDAHRMVIKFKKQPFAALASYGLRSKEQDAALQSTLNIPASEMAVSVERQVKKYRISIIRARPKEGEQVLRSQIQDFNNSPSVEYAHPLFIAEKGTGKLVLTDEILVRFSPEYDEEEVEEFCAQNGLSLIRKTRGPLNVYLLRLNDAKSQSCLDVANSLNGKEGVVWAEPNFLSEIKLHTSDPLYPDQWHLHNTGQGGGVPDADVDAPEAWTVLGSGGPGIVIAIIDDGVETTHEDLIDNIWHNPGEWGDGKETNDIDDDGNGYVDDYQGWDFYDDDNDPNPADPNDNHGTACAGVAAARGNNGLGGTGIAYESGILPIKIVKGATFVTNSLQGEAILYAAGFADVISCSWGGGAENNEVMDAIDYAVTSGRGGLGCPVFFAAGNGAARGWSEFTLMGFPSGSQAHAWVYEKDGSAAGGADAAWVDDITLQDGTFVDFEGVTPPALPADFYNFTNNDADWVTVTDPSHARSGSNSARSGGINSNEFSGLYVDKNYSVGGDLSYYVWVDAGLGDGLLALYYNGGWVPYKYFMGIGISFPASYVNSIAVGASNNLDVQSSYSQYGDEIDFVAPSNGGTLGITTTDRTGPEGYDPTNYVASFGGTSSATPLAAGIAALILSENPGLSADEVRTIMRSTCDQIGADPYDIWGWNIYYGFGRVNAAISLTLSNTPLTNFSSQSYAVAENEAVATITVYRHVSSVGAVSVDYATTDGTASAGSDYGAVSGTLWFADGDMTPQTFTVPIYDDFDTEGDETVIITLSNPGGGMLAVPSTAVLTIGDQQNYYVNDASTVNDEWCTNPGDDLNDGLTPATPKATVQSVISNYDLEQRDVIHIDTGTYTLTSNIEILESDGGSSTAPVTFLASPYGVDIDRSDSSSGSYGWYLNDCDHVTIKTAASTKYPGVPQRLMTVTGGYCGLYLYYANSCHVEGLEVYSNLDDGISLSLSEYNTFSNNLIRNNIDEGIYLASSRDNTIINNTIALNLDNQIQFSGFDTIFRNNIIWANGPGDYALYCSSSMDSPVSDYNLVYATNGAYVGYYVGTRTTLTDWQTATGEDQHSLSLDPEFVDSGSGDWHLKSTGGSYHDGAWTADGVTSPAIDAGDPTDDYSQEPEDNGDRINMGAYGGTAQASKSPADTDDDGIPDVIENASPCLDANDADTDDDGIIDGVEDANQDGVLDAGETDPCDEDTDDDWIQDGTELGVTTGHPTDTGPTFIPDADDSTTTDPLNADTDGDGLSDGEEDSANQNGKFEPHLGETDPNDPNDPPPLPGKFEPHVPLLLLAEPEIDLDLGLVAYYPFNGNANDESGNGNDGTLNGPTLTQDRFGNPDSAYYFDGIDDYIRTVEKTWGFDTTATVCAWIKTNYGPNSGIVSLSHDYVQDEMLLHIRDNKGCIVNHKRYSDFNVRYSNTSVNDGDWHFLCGQMDGSGQCADLHIFVHGIEEAGPCAGSHADIVDTYPRILRIGARTDDAFKAFNGIIDDIRIYNRVLSSDEILALYNE